VNQLDNNPGAPLAIVLWIGVCVVIFGLAAVVLYGCANSPPAPLSRLAGANPNCIRNCSASFMTMDSKGSGPFQPTVSSARTLTETETTSR